MKLLLKLIFIGIALSGQTTYACDEACMREKAQNKYSVTFPSYLTKNYCDGIARDFMASTMRSLDRYRSENFNTRYKGPLKNTRQYLEQRKDWLSECDDYLSKTMEVRIFSNDKTTQQIFASIDKVSNEFSDLIEGAKYASEGEARSIMNEKIDTLFQLVDDHRTIMHLKGKYVIR